MFFRRAVSCLEPGTDINFCDVIQLIETGSGYSARRSVIYLGYSGRAQTYSVSKTGVRLSQV